MTSEEREQITILCEKIHAETDPTAFNELVFQLLAVLERERDTTVDTRHVFC